jgi:hypothetical protein
MVRSQLSENEFKAVINGLVDLIGLGCYGKIVGLTYAGKIALAGSKKGCIFLSVISSFITL